jgi:DNA repair protein RadA/Sms
MAEISPLEVPRLPTGISEFDRTLGGGLVPGSAVLVGGDPGIGKSTLLLQAFSALAARGERVLYASSEESAQQVKLRAERILGEMTSATRDANLFLLAESSVARITNEARRVRASVLAIDSIQLVHRHDADALPGSMTQLRRCCMELVQFAKTTGTVVMIVGHVTKEGDLAGPKLLEHLVDVVLSFEGDRHHAYRLVRASKNRFGSTHEIGLFEMTGEGLAEVDESALAAANATDARPGTAIVPVMAGSRVLLAEIQALAVAGFLGSAKRKASGMDSGRLSMMIAVLEKHGGLRLADQDIYASVAGGLRIIEPAVDLAVCLSIAGAHLARALPPATAVLGEVGLSGEIRPVRALDQRVAEAIRRGCSTVLVPSGQTDSIKRHGSAIVSIRTISQALELLSPVARMN